MNVSQDLLLPHRRLNPLTGESVLVSPQRALRPWRGQETSRSAGERPPYDPACYLCPGNRRANGESNPAYDGPFVFANDYPALLEKASHAPDVTDPLFQVEQVGGACRVVCFSPRHDLTLAEMSLDAIRQVVEAWAVQSEELGGRFRWVQVFENKGEVMGCSDPHPHGQIWATDALPLDPAKEDRFLRTFLAEHARPLLMDYLDRELESKERIVVEDEAWVAVVPFWAVWPFETLLLPRRHVQRLPDLSAAERDGLAGILQRLLARYDNLFETPFPYSMGWHGAPFDGTPAAHWTLHAHFYPPLLRSATVKKFMVGYEMLAEPQRDLTAEAAAARLRALPEAHYRDRRPAAR
jgi:UDPglucose--hexose-1-phosphate uridylyltransferase